MFLKCLTCGLYILQNIRSSTRLIAILDEFFSKILSVGYKHLIDKSQTGS